MEENQNQEAPKMSSVEAEELEMNHTDKLVGVFTEPTSTFGKISNFPSKTSDWVIPILIVIVVAILSSILMMNNPTIKAAIMEKQIAAMEKSFDEAVAKGEMSRDQANQQLETVRDRMSQGGAIQMIGIVVGIPIATFIFFFVVSGAFFVLAKFILKGEGSYKEAMVAYGLPQYIRVIQTIIMIIAALVTNKLFTGTSVADFLDIEKDNITGFLLAKLDVFSIWFYIVFGIGLAKMFKTNNVQKYIIGVVAVWLGFSLLFYAIGKAVPFLSSFAG
jgi:hypothetical protein